VGNDWKAKVFKSLAIVVHRYRWKMVLTQRTDTFIHLTRPQLDRALGALCVLGMIEKDELVNSREFHFR
jgi:hypothetical protein